MEYEVDIYNPQLESRIHDSWKEILEKSWSCQLEYNTPLALLSIPFKNETQNKNELILALQNDLTKTSSIIVPSLRGLFRGSFNPGTFSSTPPPRYQAICYRFEKAWIDIVANGELPIPRDQEMYDFYYALRRRPDGQATEMMHKVLWQIWAFLLGTFPISEAEYTAVMTRLIHSASTFRTSLVSHNMYDNIAKSYELNN